MSVRDEIGDERYERALRTWRNYCRNWEGRRTTHVAFCERVRERQ